MQGVEVQWVWSQGDYEETLSVAVEQIPPLLMLPAVDELKTCTHAITLELCTLTVLSSLSLLRNSTSESGWGHIVGVTYW